MSAFDPVKIESCKNCGSTVQQFSPDSMTAVCSHCGTHTNSTEASSQYETRKQTTSKNPLFKLHETFVYQDQLWKIIGFIRYKGKIKEWDREDGRWENSPWNYNSWWVMNEARELAWVTNDEGGYKWTRKTVLDTEIPRASDRSYEVGAWKIKAAVGEFSYFPTLGGRTLTYEKKGSSIEVLLDKEGNEKEIEAFTSTPMMAIDILEGFNKPELLSSLKRMKFARNAVIASMVCLVLGYFYLSGRNDVLLNIPQTPIELKAFTKNKATPLGEMYVKNRTLLEFNLAGILPKGHGTFRGKFIVKDDKNITVKNLPVYFSRNSSRVSNSHSMQVRLPHKKQYSLSLEPSQINNWSEMAVSAKVYKNRVTTFPLVIGGMLLCILFLFLSASRFNFVQRSTGMGSTK